MFFWNQFCFKYSQEGEKRLDLIRFQENIHTIGMFDIKCMLPDGIINVNANSLRRITSQILFGKQISCCSF